ncbi:MAG: hypothetical protein N2645_02735 [Clostridia bacterium]|nr:hypothetical protein [Clostridia bacterium]
MAFKVSIGGNIILEKCVRSVSLVINPPPDDQIDGLMNIKNSMKVVGKIGIDEDISELYQWALLQANDPQCYREVILEEIRADVLVRKVVFNKAFIIDYSENYTSNKGVGTFTLLIRQLSGEEMKCANSISQNIQNEENNNIGIIRVFKEEVAFHSSLVNDIDGFSDKNNPLKPLMSTKDAENFALINNLADNINYNGLDPRVAHEWNTAISDTLQQFPELRNNLHFIGSAQERNNFIRQSLENDLKDAYMKANPNKSWTELEPYVQEKIQQIMSQLDIGPGTIAQSLEHNKFGGITVNNDYGSNYDKFKKVKENDVKKNWKPIGCDTIKATVDHELGHQLDNMLNISNDAEITKLYNLMKNNNSFEENLSGYSATSVKEFVAEGWSEYRNNPNPRPVSKQIGEKIFGRYAEWKMKK